MIHEFSVWLRTGSNPVDINRFQSHIGNEYLSSVLLTSFNTKHDFSVLLRIGSNPADINWFQSHA